MLARAGAVGLAIGCAIACGACGKSDEGPPAVTVLYGPQATTRLSPYPSNRYTTPDPASKTGLRVDIRPETTADTMVTALPTQTAALDRLDGFSTIGPIIVGFSAEIDPTNAEKAMVLVDVDDTSPERGVARPLITRYYTSEDNGDPIPDFTILAAPATPLRPRTRYAFAVSNAIVAKSGVHVSASEDMRAVLRDAPGDYAASVRAALPAIATAGIATDALALADVFTTESVVDVTAATAAAHRALPAPNISTPFANLRKPDGNDKRARFSVKFDTPELRKPDPVGTFDVDPATGAAVAQATVPLEAYLDFSDATHSGPRPVAIFAHGLGGNKDGCWGTAERLADLDVVVIGIDAPYHGSRSNPPTEVDQTDLLGSVTGFFAANPDTKQFDMERVRDNFRQMASDQLELIRFVQTLGTLDVLPVGAPDGVPDIDPTKIIYLGHSFGSVFGSGIGALAPEIQAATLNVGGDGLLTLMRDSGLFTLVIDAFRPPGTPKSDVAKFFAISQAIVDPGDPANYARYMTVEGLPGVPNWRAKDVLIQEVELDGIVPNTSTEVLARALGLPQVGRTTHLVPQMTQVAGPVSANLPSGATGGLAQFDTMDGKTAEHGGLIFTDDARRQYVEFFRGSLAGGRATINAPYAQ